MKRKNLFSQIIIILLIAIGGLSLYFKILRSSEIITLGPEVGETKKKPEEPGGIVIPNSDSLVYEKLQKITVKNRKVNILPEPEEPIDLGQKIEESQVVYLDSIDEILANIDNYNETINLGSTQAEGYILPSDTKPLEASGTEEIQQKIDISGTDLNIIISSENRFKFTDVNIVSSENDGYKIQLYLTISEADAHKFWQEAIKRYSKILNGANLIIRKVNGKNDRKLYVVMAGIYPSINHAKLVCNRLIKCKQNCIVTK